MDVISVSCNKCGAPLEAAPTVRFVTCVYCKSRLEIKRTDSAVYTEVLDRIDQRTEQISQDVRALRRAQEIENLDRNWQARRQSFMSRDSQGAATPPSAAVGIIAGIGAILVGISWMVLTSSMLSSADRSMPSGMGPPVAIQIVFPMFGLPFVIGGIVSAVWSVSRAGAYRRELELYESDRRRLVEDAARER